MFVRIKTMGDHVATGGIFVVREPNVTPAAALQPSSGGVRGTVPMPQFIDVKLFPSEIVDMTDSDLFDQLSKKFLEEVDMKELPEEKRHPTRPLRFTDADEAKEFRKRYHWTRSKEIMAKVSARLKAEYPLDPKTKLPKCQDWEVGTSDRGVVDVEDID